MEDNSPQSPSHGDNPGSQSPSSRCTTPSSTFSESPIDEVINVTPDTVARLVQCSRCSLPFRMPLRLPCGDSICRACLPPIQQRTGVSYPAIEERKQGFTCYRVGGECGADHCLGDCGTDVLLTRLVEVFDEILGTDSNTTSEGDVGQTITWSKTLSGEGELALAQSAEIGPDPLKGVFVLVKGGRLSYDAHGICYHQPDRITCYTRFSRTLDKLRAAVRNELDCQVCYALIIDPLTTPCGHTFCRSCVSMALSHSNLCPICRRKLNMSLSVRSEQVNKRLSDIVQTLLPEEVTSRRADLASDIDAVGDAKLPLAVVSLAFPTMPIGLHIFEPRYRLMIQRVMESRSRKFGMVMPNRRGRLQQGLGRAPFMQYGTILSINRHELLPDGRSLLIATGTSRFKVVSWDLVDGYHVGKIQRVDDVSISEEETQESRETAAIESASRTRDVPIESMSTQQLYQLVLDFVLKERRQGAPWLHPRVLLAYGALPTDPALFPWWFATVLPKWEEEKYTLLATTTVRQRLKITAGWVKTLESRQWYVTCTNSKPEGSDQTGVNDIDLVLILGFPGAVHR
ncbi:putative ATP-dependent protease (CrgA) [Aspergillus mulundensis]|uniref:ATP-dependent protease n=1 Tax=Aspergillus mulundensis TaxID=1810919 RepID=A0A3D8SWT4_9EURO|nr:Uncharacterized protein DSM5745_02494 [Aspergillus mulundensis]RDW90719.1 Uncharacterized protein DSM5745_02494 [Aspergillus mulundensis]